MKKIALPAICVAAICLINSCADPQRAKNYNNETQLDESALSFAKTAAEAGQTEIAASQVAEKNSKNPRITGFARMMITDHTKAGTQLDTVASHNLADLPTKPSQTHQKMIDSISKLSGDQFDKAYMQMMVKDHEAAVGLFTDTKANRAAAIKNYAVKTLPVIQMHLDSAKAILASLK